MKPLKIFESEKLPNLEYIDVNELYSKFEGENLDFVRSAVTLKVNTTKLYDETIAVSKTGDIIISSDEWNFKDILRKMGEENFYFVWKN